MMTTLNIKKTHNSPEILLDAEQGLIEITGASFLENSLEFYEPVIKWIEQYTISPKDTTVNVELKYFNSSSAKVLLTLFKNLSEVKKSSFQLVVNWTYKEDDEDIMDSGLDFAKLSGLEFNLIEKKSAVK